MCLRVHNGHLSVLIVASDSPVGERTTFKSLSAVHCDLSFRSEYVQMTMGVEEMACEKKIPSKMVASHWHYLLYRGNNDFPLRAEEPV